ncbi:hypothetical protein D3C76_1013980 [compost metagenome]
MIQAEGDGLRHLRVQFDVGAIQALEKRTVSFYVQVILEVEVDFTGVGQANPGAGLWGVDDAYISAVTPGAVLVFILPVGTIGEAQWRTVDGRLGLQRPVHGLEADAY